MKKSTFSETEIAETLQQAEAGTPIAEVTRAREPLLAVQPIGRSRANRRLNPP